MPKDYQVSGVRRAEILLAGWKELPYDQLANMLALEGYSPDLVISTLIDSLKAHEVPASGTQPRILRLGAGPQALDQ